jgi:hypothetical protein
VSPAQLHAGGEGSASDEPQPGEKTREADERVAEPVSDGETQVSDNETAWPAEVKGDADDDEPASGASSQPSDPDAPSSPTPTPATDAETPWGTESVPNRRPTQSDG